MFGNKFKAIVSLPGMEKVSDHGTIGRRKKLNSQKILPKGECID